jgi:hypothetical protein
MKPGDLVTHIEFVGVSTDITHQEPLNAVVVAVSDDVEGFRFMDVIGHTAYMTKFVGRCAYVLMSKNLVWIDADQLHTMPPEAQDPRCCQ